MKEYRSQPYMWRDKARLPKEFTNLPNATARAERRTLLLLSTLAILLGAGHSAPATLSGGGVTVNLENPQLIYWFLAAIQTYLILAFWLYSAGDYAVARKTWATERSESPVVSTRRAGGYAQLWLHAKSRTVTYALWFFLEFYIPYIVAAIGISLMVGRALQS